MMDTMSARNISSAKDHFASLDDQHPVKESLVLIE
jgi:hypothetical protein